VIFDLEGVLVDSEQVWDDVRESFVRERGGEWSADVGQHAVIAQLGQLLELIEALVRFVVGLSRRRLLSERPGIDPEQPQLLLLFLAQVGEVAAREVDDVCASRNRAGAAALAPHRGSEAFRRAVGAIA
jgi:beta-phosphoglucomutase-like phosphatase (HAD superfamily)